MTSRGRRAIRRSLAALAVTVALVPGLWAPPTAAQPTPPSQPPPATIPTVTVVAREATFEAPDTLPPGMVTITFLNATAGSASAQVSRLRPGTTEEALSAALQAEDDAAFYALVTPAGGVGSIGPGRSQEATLILSEGDYILLSFSGGQPVLRPFKVAGPRADGEVSMREFSFSLPPIGAGQPALKVVNAGTQPHEMLLGKLAPGLTLQDVLAFEGDPEEAGMVELAGGLTAIEPGATAWVTPTFTPGTYGMVCFVPDPATGKPHFELGMAAEFTVP